MLIRFVLSAIILFLMSLPAVQAAFSLGLSSRFSFMFYF